ncbi:unnamed protein product [Tuber melanosporum]|uniref:Cytochrome c oxidase subunit 8, mitochondrial n=1 Tax=Tuber melanosporum (strain Mel28) TaxID=656061 RepID=D5GM20_TUBMM|nr:uncharacterized protein GSTUM_00010487001 [Tuber melanosporum]CAZ85563.1 unnamed protein product [Tuber melanosporum]
MIQRTAFRLTFATTQAPYLMARRGLHATPVRLGGYHYPEGPRSNIPFNPHTRFFYLRFIAFCTAGFGFPFGVTIWQSSKNKA